MEITLTAPEEALRAQTLKEYQALLELTKNISNLEMRQAIELFLKEHSPVIDFFTLVSESNYDVRVADETPQGPSASTRENIAHIIVNLEDRIGGLEQGKFEWRDDEAKQKAEEPLRALTKPLLLERLMKADKRLVEISQDQTLPTRNIVTKYATITSAQFMRDIAPHQVFHQGLHGGLMDKMGMPRPQSYTNRWGK